MQNEATRYVYSLISRLSKFARRQLSGDETGSDLAMFGLIFCPENDDNARRIRMTDLSRRLMISKPAATQAINRLVENGLVSRTRDEADRRVVYIQPTQEGLEQFENSMNERLKVVDSAIERIGLEKAQQLGILLDEFVDALLSVSEV